MILSAWGCLGQVLNQHWAQSGVRIKWVSGSLIAARSGAVSLLPASVRVASLIGNSAAEAPGRRIENVSSIRPRDARVQGSGMQV